MQGKGIYCVPLLAQAVDHTAFGFSLIPCAENSRDYFLAITYESVHEYD